jgi:hypothetical protein
VGTEKQAKPTPVLEQGAEAAEQEARVTMLKVAVLAMVENL